MGLLSLATGITSTLQLDRERSRDPGSLLKSATLACGL